MRLRINRLRLELEMWHKAKCVQFHADGSSSGGLNSGAVTSNVEEMKEAA